MANTPDALWLCVNPKLRKMDQRLYQQLNRQTNVRFWNYHQAADQPCCVEAALALLHRYIRKQSKQMHLIGHGLSGVLGLLYARMYPHYFKSLTLLSVGVNPAVGWSAHYYTMRNLLPCSREMTLAQVVRMLFGPLSSEQTKRWVKLLADILDHELTHHSLVQHNGFAPGGIAIPLLVCNGAHDAVVDPNAHEQWQEWLKPGDRLWSCPQGRYFFHHDYPQRSSEEIFSFWEQITTQATALPLAEFVGKVSNQ